MLVSKDDLATQRQLARAIVAEEDYDAYKLLVVDEGALSKSQPLSSFSVDIRDELDLIRIDGYEIDTSNPAPTYAKLPSALRNDFVGRMRAGLPPPEHALYLVQFVGPVQPRWRKALEDDGLHIVQYIPENAYVVRADRSAAQRVANLSERHSFVQFTGDYEPGFKIARSLRGVPSGALIDLVVQLIQRPGIQTVLSQLEEMSSSELQTTSVANYLDVELKIDAGAITDIAEMPDVFSVGPRPDRKRLDEVQGQILANNLSGNLPSGPGYIAWLGTRGFASGQFQNFVVEIADDSHAVTGHPDLDSGRVVFQNNPTAATGNQGGHGFLNTHIISGYDVNTGAAYVDASGYHYGVGIAPYARVGVTDIFGPSTASSVDWENTAYGLNARISSNSWGYTFDYVYDAFAQQYDVIARDAQPSTAGLQELIVLFAAGNDGPGVYSVGSPATAKNVITVAAGENVRTTGTDGCSVANTGADSANDMAFFSGHGPVGPTDMRQKPDITAPGTHIQAGVPQSAYSGTSICNQYWPTGQTLYGWSSGTSHSTPAVAGGAALVYQYFLNQSLTPPSPAMMKAYLMSSAEYMTGSGANDILPSGAQGMGRMNLARAFDGTARVMVDQLQTFGASGQTFQASGTITDSSKPFRVTLAWSDAPGPTTGAAWVNNLDLTVTVGAQTYRGNVFGAGGLSTTGGTADIRNNVESVFLPAGTTGSYTVTVTATNIAGDGVPGNANLTDQDFALVIYNGAASGAPTIGTTASSLAFSQYLGAPAPAAQGLGVYNSGGGTFSWTGTVDQPWLSISPTSGGPLASISVSVDTTGLGVGTYNGNLTLTAPGASNSPRIIPVTLTISPSDFSVSCTPVTATTPQGRAVAATCTVTSLGNFTSAVNLACSNLPAGTTCTFTPSSVTPAANSSATSALSIDVGGTTAAGTYSINVDGTSGAFAHSVHIDVTVIVPEFNLNCGGATTFIQSVAGDASRSGSATCTITSVNNYTGPVDFTCSVSPAGPTCFPPTQTVNLPAGGTNFAFEFVSAVAGTPPADYVTTITARSGVAVHTENVQTVIDPNCDDITQTPVNLSPLNASDTVSTTPLFSWTPVPNAGYYLVQAWNTADTSGGAFMTRHPTFSPYQAVTADAFRPGTTYYWQVQALNYCHHSPTSALSNFTTGGSNMSMFVSCDQFGLNVSQGGSATTNCTIFSSLGFAGNAEMSCPTLPAGASCAFSVNPVTVPLGGSPVTVVTVTAGSSTPVGSSLMEIRGTNGPVSSTYGIGLTVSACAALSLPVLSGPADNATNVTPNASLTWNAVTGAATYTAQIATDAAFTNIVRSVTQTGTTYAFSPQLNVSQTYFWRVSANSSCGTSGYTATRRFTTGNFPGPAMVSCSPSSVTVPRSGSASTTCTVQSRNNFSGSAAMSCTGLATGVSCAFSPASVSVSGNNSATTNVTISANSSATVGAATSFVVGTSGGLAPGTPVSVNVTAPCTAAAAPVLLSPADNSTNYFTTTPTLNWNPVSNATSYLLQIATDSGFTNIVQSQTVGTDYYTLTTPLNYATQYYWRVQASNSCSTSAFSTAFRLTTLVAPALTMACNPVSISAAEGSSASTTCTVTSVHGFAGSVSFGCSGQPADVSCAYSPSTVTLSTGGLLTTTLTANVGANVPLGTYNFNATASGGAASASGSVSLGVTCAVLSVPAPSSPADGATGVVVSPSLEWSAVSGASSYTVQLAADSGFSNILQQATVSGTSYAVSPALAYNTAYYWRVAANNACSSTAYSAASSFTTVFNPQISLACSPTSLEVTQGNSGGSACTITSINGFAGAVTFDCTGLASGVDCAYTPNPVVLAAGETAPVSLAVNVAGSAAVGSSSFSARAVSGALSSQVGFNLTVDCAISAAPALASPADGVADMAIDGTLSWNASSGATSYSVQIATDAAFTNIVQTGSPSGTSYAISPVLQYGTVYYWRVAANNSCSSGAYGAARSFQTVPAPAISLACSPASLTAGAGTSVTSACTVTSINNFVGSVTLSCSGLPSGISCAYSPSPVSVAAGGTGASTLTVTVGPAVSPSTYGFNATATSGALSASAAISVTTTPCIAPGPLSPSTPANGATGQSTTPVLTWSASSAATSYTVQVATDSSFAHVVREASLSGTSYTVAPALLAGTVYYWHVSAMNNCGIMEGSAVYSFTTASAALTNLFTNSGFESGTTGWSTAGNGAAITNNTAFTAHAGSWYGRLGNGNSTSGAIYRSVTIPSNATVANLQYYYNITSAETSVACNDFMAVELHNGTTGALITQLRVYCNGDKTTGWLSSPVFDITAYKGQPLIIGWFVSTNASLVSTFLIDDLTLNTDGH